MKDYIFSNDFSRNLDAMIYTCGYETCEPSHSYGPVVRSGYLIHYILEGKGIYKTDGHIWQLSEGDAFLIRPNTLIYYEADKYHPWTYTWIGFQGILPKETTVGELAKLLDRTLLSEGPYHIFGDAGRKIMRVAAISGGGAFPEVFGELYSEGVDCLVTGEMTHEAFHYASEAGVAVIAMGHYRSETPGVDAVMREVSEHFDVETDFIDLPTGM